MLLTITIVATKHTIIRAFVNSDDAVMSWSIGISNNKMDMEARKTRLTK